LIVQNAVSHSALGRSGQQPAGRTIER